jgi:hypothetical protein
VPAFERELAPAQRTAEKHCKHRTVPFSFDGVEVGPGEQVARLFPGEPVPCPVAGLADALKGDDSPATLRSRKPFSGFFGKLADRDNLRLMEAGAKPADSRTLRYC